MALIALWRFRQIEVIEDPESAKSPIEIPQRSWAGARKIPVQESGASQWGDFQVGIQVASGTAALWEIRHQEVEVINLNCRFM